MDKTSRTTSIKDSAASVTVSSPAKVNLILHILNRRPDGYHNLWSLMQTIGLADDLTITLDPASTEIRLTCSHPDVPLGPANLIHRAAAAVLAHVSPRTGLRIDLNKRIPMGAGLGGGSSNAAATVVALNRLLDLGWSVPDMVELTHSLGSDVPFFFFAPTAIVAGRGERVQPLRLIGRRTLLLVNPGFGVETAWAYRALAAGRTEAPKLPESLVCLDRATSLGWEDLTPVMGNDFEPVVFPAHPVLGMIKSRLLEAGAESAFLSGTGATVFGVFPSDEAAVVALPLVATNPDWQTWVVPTHTDGLSAEPCP